MKKRWMARLAAALLFLSLAAPQSARGLAITLRVAVEPYLPPFQFVSEGKCAGVHIDLFDAIALDNDFVVEYVVMESQGACFRALEAGDVDLVLGAPGDSGFDAQLTDELSQSFLCAIASKEQAGRIKSILSTGFLVAVLQDDIIDQSYIMNMRNLLYIKVPNQVRAVETFFEQEADLLLGVKASLLYQLDKAGLSDDYTIINNYIAQTNYAIALRPGDRELLLRINRGLAGLRASGRYEEIHNKWLNEGDYQFRQWFRRISWILLIVAAVIILFVAFNMRYSYLLKRQIAQKTRELKRVNADLEGQIILVRNAGELRDMVIENSDKAIFVLDRSLRITIMNKSAVAMTGLPVNPTGMNAMEIDLLGGLLADKLEALLTPGTRYINEELAAGDVTYRYDIYQLFDQEGAVRAISLMLSDITRDIAIREQIYEQEKNKALNQIIAGIAHEIRNPLSSIKTFIELLGPKRDNPQFQHKLVELVPREVERVDGLINNLMDYAKPDSERKDMVSLCAIIRSCTMLMEHVMEGENIRLQVDAQENLTVYANRDQLTQVIINLLLNSFEAVTGSTRQRSWDVICVNAWQEGAGIYLRVRDKGCGMSREEVKKATEPFFTTKPKGTGLGLYLTKQYVEENNGTIAIDSVKGAYTSVTLRFQCGLTRP